MTQAPEPPTTNRIYYSAHGGPVFDPNGEFHHFARAVDRVHTLNGYWRFCSYEDDRRAYSHGLLSPEAVLIAQDVGDGVYNDIMLRWVPGELDSGNKPTIGSAAAHLETIYSERRVLGKPRSFRGSVPLYPLSTDTRLLNYRLMRYGVQKGILPATTIVAPIEQASSHNESPQLTPVQHAEPCRAPPVTPLSASTNSEVDRRLLSESHATRSNCTARLEYNFPKTQAPMQDTPSSVSPSSAQTNPCMDSPLLCTQQPQLRPALSPSPLRLRNPVAEPTQIMGNLQLASQASYSPLSHAHERQRPHGTLLPLSLPQVSNEFASPMQTVDTPTPQRVRLLPSNPDAHHKRSIPTDMEKPRPISPSSLGSSLQLPIGRHNSCNEQHPAEGGEDSFSTLELLGATDNSGDRAPLLSYARLTPSQVFDLESATLPCMDCGSVGTHMSYCWISKATLSLRTAEETTAHQYRKLTEDVKRFDPAPWVTHVGPPNDAEFDDPIAQVRDIAEIVRDLDTFVEDPGLRTLDDSFTVLLWALKDSNEIQIIEGPFSNPGFDNLDHKDYEMLDL